MNLNSGKLVRTFSSSLQETTAVVVVEITEEVPMDKINSTTTRISSTLNMFLTITQSLTAPTSNATMFITGVLLVIRLPCALRMTQPPGPTRRGTDTVTCRI